MITKFDLAVIGGGPGGYVAAIRALQLGLKVAVIEQKDIGGTCLNWGCIPTKSLLHSAEVYHMAKHSSDFGVDIKGVTFDYARIVKRKDSIVGQLRQGIDYLVKNNGGIVLKGRAQIKDKNTIEVKGKENSIVKADKIIIATGSRPLKPPITGMDGSRVLESDKVLALDYCPEKVVIIGGGVIGVEFATIYNTLGKEVFIIEMMNNILPGVDSEVSSLLRKSLETKGIKIFTGAKVTSIVSDKIAVCTFEKEGKLQKAEGEIIIVATGRKPNTENLGLEKIGVSTERGFIQVNDKMETSVNNIYAIGDVTGKVMLAHVASAQGIVAASNAAGKSRTMEYGVIPGCIYTSPEIATVGLTEDEAAGKKIKLSIGRFNVNINGKSMIAGEKEGMVKIISDEKTGEILGAHIMGPRATDMIAEICVAMKLESTAEELSDIIHPHPTVSEMIMEAAHDIEGLCVHKPKR